MSTTAGTSRPARLPAASEQYVLLNDITAKDRQGTSQPQCKGGNSQTRRKVIRFQPLQENPVYCATQPGGGLKGLAGAATIARLPTQPISIAREFTLVSRTKPDQDQVTFAASPVVLRPLPPPFSTPHTADDETIGSWKSRRTTHQLSKNSTALPFTLAKPAATKLTSIQTNLAKHHHVHSAVPSGTEKAWRQRFVHKWRKEQARPCKICNDDTCDDPWHAALHMLQAANVHPDLQMPVPDHDCYPAGASPSPLLSVDDDLDGILEVENTVVEPADGASKALTIHSALSEAACRARQLLKHQVHACNFQHVRDQDSSEISASSCTVLSRGYWYASLHCLPSLICTVTKRTESGRTRIWCD